MERWVMVRFVTRPDLYSVISADLVPMTTWAGKSNKTFPSLPTNTFNSFSAPFKFEGKIKSVKVDLVK